MVDRQLYIRDGEIEKGKQAFQFDERKIGLHFKQKRITALKSIIFFYFSFITIDHLVLFVVCLFKNTEISLTGKGMKGVLLGKGDIPTKSRFLQKKGDCFLNNY